MFRKVITEMKHFHHLKKVGFQLVLKKCSTNVCNISVKLFLRLKFNQFPVCLVWSRFVWYWLDSTISTHQSSFATYKKMLQNVSFYQKWLSLANQWQRIFFVLFERTARSFKGVFILIFWPHVKQQMEKMAHFFPISIIQTNRKTVWGCSHNIRLCSFLNKFKYLLYKL